MLFLTPKPAILGLVAAHPGQGSAWSPLDQWENWKADCFSHMANTSLTASSSIEITEHPLCVY